MGSGPHGIAGRSGELVPQAKSRTTTSSRLACCPVQHDRAGLRGCLPHHVLWEIARPCATDRQAGPVVDRRPCLQPEQNPTGAGAGVRLSVDLGASMGTPSLRRGATDRRKHHRKLRGPSEVKAGHKPVTRPQRGGAGLVQRGCLASRRTLHDLFMVTVDRLLCVTRLAVQQEMAMRQDWRCASIEPDLDEVFADPVIQAMMHRDGLSETQLRQTITAMWRARCWRGSLPCAVQSSAT